MYYCINNNNNIRLINNDLFKFFIILLTWQKHKLKWLNLNSNEDRIVFETKQKNSFKINK